MFTQTTEYILQALVYLTTHRNREPILARKIAEETHIPMNYLSKLLHELKRAGYLEAARGRNGGYRLAREPEDIRLTEIVTRFDTIEPYNGCLLRRSECRANNPCSAHSRWRPIAEQMLQFMDETTVSDLAE